MIPADQTSTFVEIRGAWEPDFSKTISRDPIRCSKEFFEKVERTSEESFEASHGVMTSIVGRFENGAFIVDVTNVAPDFDDPESMKSAMDDRRRWTTFLDKVTGYNAKQRGDKAKEETKKFSKAKSAIKMAHKSMDLMKNLDQETIDKANELIASLEAMIEAGTPPSETQVKKLDKLF